VPEAARRRYDGSVSRRRRAALRALSRARIRASRRLLTAVLGSPRLCAALGSTRRTEVDGRTLDRQAALAEEVGRRLGVR